MSLSKPLSPNEVFTQHQAGVGIPDFVINVVNSLLVKKTAGRDRPWKNILITQTEIKEALVEWLQANPETVQTQVAGTDLPDGWIKWLNFEPLFEKHGWKVVFSKSPYYSTEPSVFSFFELS